MTSSSTTTADLSQKAQTASASGLRAGSQAKSRLTVRLPDLSSARIPSPAPVAAAARSPKASEPVLTFSAEADEGAYENRVRPGRTSAFGKLPRKTLELVRQPKFWLACIVAVAVQIVLALIMTPADADPAGGKRPATSAKPWPKASEEPAARIVVPAAPANLNDERSDSMPSGTSPMAPALPQEPMHDSGAQGNASPSAAGVADGSAAVRMAENRALADDSRHFDGQPRGEADGATLGGIAPFEPVLPASDRGPRQ